MSKKKKGSGGSGNVFPKRLYKGERSTGPLDLKGSDEGGVLGHSSQSFLFVTVNGAPLPPGSAKHADHFDTDWARDGTKQLAAAILENEGFSGTEAFERLLSYLHQQGGAPWIISDLDIQYVLTEIDYRGLR